MKKWVVVYVGQTKSRRYANVVGPFDEKRLAMNYAARSRNEREFPYYKEHNKISIHVRQMITPKEGRSA